MDTTVQAPPPAARYALLSGRVKAEADLSAYLRGVESSDRPERLLDWAERNSEKWKEAA